jgi:hypothetical protein
MLPKHDLRPCACGAEIRWTITTAGRKLAVDAKPHPLGNVACHRDHMGTWRSRVPNAELPLANFEKLFMPHAATCTSPPPAKKPRARAARDLRMGPGAQVELDLGLGLPEGVSSLAAYRRRRSP